MTPHVDARWYVTGLLCLCASLHGCATPFAGGRLMHSNHRGEKEARERTAAANQLKDPVGLYLTYGHWQEQLGNLKEARSSYEQTLAEQPKSVDAILGLARLDQLGGRISQAEAGFQRAMELQPKSPKVLDAVGQFYLSQEKWDKSIEMLKSAMAAAPSESLYAFHLAVALTESGDPDDAFPLFAKSVGDAQAHYNIGLILHKQGKIEASAARFEKALEMQPSLREAQYWLAKIKGTSDKGVQLANGSDEQTPVNAPGRPNQIATAGHTTGPPPNRELPSGNSISKPAATSSANPSSQRQMSPSQWEQWRNQSAGPAGPKS